jgi:hypothetical protein
MTLERSGSAEESVGKTFHDNLTIVYNDIELVAYETFSLQGIELIVFPFGISRTMHLSQSSIIATVSQV